MLLRYPFPFFGGSGGEVFGVVMLVFGWLVGFVVAAIFLQ